MLLALIAAAAVQSSGAPAPLPVSMPIEPTNCALIIGAVGDPKLRQAAVIKYYENHMVVISWPLPEDQASRDTEDMIVQLDNGWYAQSSGHISRTSSPDGDPAKLSGPNMSASFEPAFAEEFAKARSIAFWDDRVAREEFALSNIPQPNVEKWTSCIDAIQKRSVISDGGRAGYKRQKPLQVLVPRQNPGSWVNSNDYPSHHPREGTVHFSLDVTLNGRVRSCTVTRSSGYGDLDHVTCSKLSRRARFIPATDKNGRPYGAEYKNRVTWAFPKDDLVMPVTAETN